MVSLILSLVTEQTTSAVLCHASAKKSAKPYNRNHNSLWDKVNRK
jgi:hypothetical protein